LFLNKAPSLSLGGTLTVTYRPREKHPPSAAFFYEEENGGCVLPGDLKTFFYFFLMVAFFAANPLETCPRHRSTSLSLAGPLFSFGQGGHRNTLRVPFSKSTDFSFVSFPPMRHSPRPARTLYAFVPPFFFLFEYMHFPDHSLKVFPHQRVYPTGPSRSTIEITLKIPLFV